ncbi:hypothetical protein D3C76_694420 [compost metagenome]
MCGRGGENSRPPIPSGRVAANGVARSQVGKFPGVRRLRIEHTLRGSDFSAQHRPLHREQLGALVRIGHILP